MRHSLVQAWHVSQVRPGHLVTHHTGVRDAAAPRKADHIPLRQGLPFRVLLQEVLDDAVLVVPLPMRFTRAELRGEALGVSFECGKDPGEDVWVTPGEGRMQGGQVGEPIRVGFDGKRDLIRADVQGHVGVLQGSQQVKFCMKGWGAARFIREEIPEQGAEHVCRVLMQSEPHAGVQTTQVRVEDQGRHAV